MQIFITNLWTNPEFFFEVTVVVIFSICLHECSHAYAALLFGDSTAADNGHLTLNPMKQMGTISMLMFLMIGFAWGAVPVDVEKLREKNRFAPALVALAGPAVNLLLFVIAYVLLGLVGANVIEVGDTRFAENVVRLIFLMGLYNFVLCVFNLIPAPGLDGWTVLNTVFPAIRKVSSETVKGFMVFLIFVALTGANYLFELGTYVMATGVMLFSHA